MQDIENGIGRLDSVSGSRVGGLFDGGGGTEPLGAVGIGSLVKIRTPSSTVFGAVNNLTTRYSAVPGEASRTAVDIDLIGEILDGDGQAFQRGVSFFPPIGAAFAPAAAGDIAAVYGRPDGSNVRIGSVHQDADLPAHLRTDDLLGKHFAVLGTTGSGKSCSVALILRAILSQHAAGHVILLDPHNEYGAAFGDLAEVVTTADLQLPYWLLTFEEMVEVMVSKEGADRQAEIAILKEAIVNTKKAMAGDGAETGHITVDTPVPFRIGEFRRFIDNAMGRLDKPEGAAPYQRLLARLESLNADKRFAFMFSSLVVRDTMTDLLSRILRIPVAGKPITIIDISGVPSEIVDVVVSVLCRMVFDFALWSVQEKTVPVLLVCEEAHRYVPERDDLGFGPTKQSISRIAKEGRKYGVSVCLVSQRPSELSAGILSQCGTLFALRMGNEQDQDFVRRALPENAHGLLDVLPALRTQEAVVVGEGVAVPMRIRFDTLDEAHQPRSGAAPFSEVWQDDTEQLSYIEETVDRWRHQRR